MLWLGRLASNPLFWAAFLSLPLAYVILTLKEKFGVQSGLATGMASGSEAWNPRSNDKLWKNARLIWLIVVPTALAIVLAVDSSTRASAERLRQEASDAMIEQGGF